MHAPILQFLSIVLSKITVYLIKTKMGNQILKKSNCVFSKIVQRSRKKPRSIMDQETAVSSGPSRKEIWKMFDQISPTYDCVNRIMTFGLDQRWRKRLCTFLPLKKSMHILDCATGTGDQIIALFEKRDDIAHVTGIDLAEEMVKIGAQKIGKKSYASQTTFQVASALQIPYPDAHFDCITIAFGIRNVSDVMATLQEFRRVLKPGGSSNSRRNSSSKPYSKEGPTSLLALYPPHHGRAHL